MKKWLPGFALLSLFFSLSGAFAEEPAGSQATSFEAALLIAEDKLLPAEICVPEGEDLQLHVLNTRKLAGKFVVPGLDKETVLKPGKVETFTIPAAMIAQNAKCQFACKQSKFEGTAALKTGFPEAGKTTEIALIGQRLKFLPEVTTIPAGQPLMVYLYSLASLPHSDFEIYGADIKLPFQNKKLVAIEIKDGLTPGTYLLSRPKFPKQKHNIKTRFEVIATEVEKGE